MIFNSLGSNYQSHDAWNALAIFRRNGRQQLESFLAERYNTQATAMYKGRQALCLALQQLELAPGSSVAVNGYTCFAVYHAVAEAGYAPVFLDIAEDNLNFSATTLQQAISDGAEIKAVIVQNTLGFQPGMPGIEAVCRQHDIPLIEDLAHSIGLRYMDGREAGTVGVAAALSFSQDKVIDAVSGGALLSQHKKGETPGRQGRFSNVKDRLYMPNTLVIRGLYSVGIGKVYNFILRKLALLPRPMDGTTKPAQQLDNWHSALVLQRFQQLEATIEHRQEIATVYRDVLPADVQLPHQKGGIYLRFPILVDAPNDLIQYLRQRDIHISDTWYDAPISPAQYLQHTNYQQGSCPRAEYVARRMVNLPTHINVSAKQARLIAEEISSWLSQAS